MDNEAVPKSKDEKHLNKMHAECGIAEQDFPVSIKFLPSKAWVEQG